MPITVKKIAHFEKSLREHLGNAASGSFEAIGLSNTDVIQLETTLGMETFIAITGNFNEALATEILTVAQANAMIDARFISRYEKQNPELLLVSLKKKVDANTIDLAQMPVTMGGSEEIKYLYEHGVNGIFKTVPTQHFTE